MNNWKKVKIFTGGDNPKLEAEINSFLTNPNIKILHVAQTEYIEPGEMGVYSSQTWLTITIFYEEG